jgi:outer membrane autotransporter protein
VGSATINGTLAPGNSIGTLTVAGDLAFGAGSGYRVEVSPTAADRTNVGGRAALAGTVQVEAAPGSYTPGALYTILAAIGGVNGRFAGLATNMVSTSFLTPQLAYDSHTVYFTLGRNSVRFADIGQTPNQAATGAAVDNLAFGNPLVDTVAGGTAAQARQAFDALSGEIHASAAGVLLEDSRFVRDAVSGRLRQSYGGSGPLTALGPRGPVVAYAAEPAALGYAAAPQPQFAAWTQAVGAWGQVDGDGNAAALDRRLGGFLTGLDATFGHAWRFGLAGGYTRSWFDAAGRASRGSSDNYHLALYGGGQFGGFSLRSGAAVTWHDLEITRTAAFTGFTDTLRSAYAARSAQVFGELGHGFVLGTTALEPYAALAHVAIETDRLSENGGAAALSGSSAHDLTFATLGLRAASVLMLNETPLTVRGGLGWRYAFGAVAPDATLAFRNGIAFTVAGAPIARDSLVAEAGLDLDLSVNAKLGLTYSGALATTAHDHALKGSLLVRF